MARAAADLLSDTTIDRLAVKVTPDALRRIRAGHPWVFDGSIRSVSRPGRPGDLAVVFDDRRRFAAIGLWDPTSPIRIRILHVGEPRTIDGAFLSDRILAASHRRDRDLAGTDTDGYRLLNGEGDGLPGLILDRYADTVVAKLYSAAWLPHLRAVTDAVTGPVGIGRVVLRLSRAVTASSSGPLVDGVVLAGDAVTGEVEFSEHGLRFGADVVRGHKTGHFLDQRDNRVAVGAAAAGRRVLDVFAATGGFSVHAAAGGAASVHSVDISEPALLTAARNLDRNGALVSACTATREVGDAFEVMEHHAAAGRRWDVVVVDPPSFAPRADRHDSAMRAYARLTRLGLALTETGGRFVQSSCSSRVGADEFHRQVEAVARREGVRFADVRHTGHGCDHPAPIPELQYLKTTFATVAR